MFPNPLLKVRIRVFPVHLGEMGNKELSSHNEFCFNGASVQSISARIISAWCISAVSLHGVSLQVRPRAWGGAEVGAQAATGMFAFKGQVTKLVCFS